MKTIYFDCNATTPLDPAVRSAMMPFLDDIYGNPSSVHLVGRKARALLDDARDRVARVWKCKPNEIIFTSGGTESSNSAIFGAVRLLANKGRHLVTSLIEHPAVLHCFQYLEKRGFEVSYLKVDREGIISPEDLERALRPDTILVSLMAANNETGSLQDVARFGLICRSRGVLFHTDAVQFFGKEPFSDIHQFNADLVSFCAHKLYGPKGAGALFVRSPLHPIPLIFGGSHEHERRAGTENTAAIAGLAEAAVRFIDPPVFSPLHLRKLTDRIIDSLIDIDGVLFRGSRTARLANTIAFTVSGCDSITLLAGLDLEGICASSGSACAAGSLEPSHVLLAMGVEPSLANSLVRFSLGRDSTEEDVERTISAMRNVINRARRR